MLAYSLRFSATPFKKLFIIQKYLWNFPDPNWFLQPFHPNLHKSIILGMPPIWLMSVCKKSKDAEQAGGFL
jgi:hypothetical protein